MTSSKVAEKLNIVTATFEIEKPADMTNAEKFAAAAQLDLNKPEELYLAIACSTEDNSTVSLLKALKVIKVTLTTAQQTEINTLKTELAEVEKIPALKAVKAMILEKIAAIESAADSNQPKISELFNGVNKGGNRATPTKKAALTDDMLKKPLIVHRTKNGHSEYGYITHVKDKTFNYKPLVFKGEISEKVIDGNSYPAVVSCTMAQTQETGEKAFTVERLSAAQIVDHAYSLLTGEVTLKTFEKYTQDSKDKYEAKHGKKGFNISWRSNLAIFPTDMLPKNSDGQNITK